MELLLLLLPLLGSLLLLSVGRRLGSFWGPRLATLLVLAALLLALFSFLSAGLGQEIHLLSCFPWFGSSLLRLSWGLQLDGLAVSMLLVVLSISFFVHLYSLEYMAGDPHLNRFFAYLSLFTFFMLLLVLSPNLPQLFVGWEGVGLCSYLLISFWFTRRQASKAALKAMVVNRVGDGGLLMAMALLYGSTGTLDFGTLFALAPHLADLHWQFPWGSSSLLTVSCLCLLVGAVGKSAQLGLHSWLPDAMEGPTPVSALIHAATMVTAGVFLLIRCSPLLELAPPALGAVALVGALTALFGATVGLFQNDLKRVVAYSTCSQLGYMVFACGLSAYSVALFHLFNHAFFKALLFLGSGAVIHAYGDEQDMRRMGGLVRLLPFTYAAMLTGSLSLMGTPFLTGYYSKDLILEVSASLSGPTAQFCFWLGSLSALFTAFYSFRLLHMAFLAHPRGPRPLYEGAGSHEAGVAMGITLLLLSFASLFFGYLFRDLFVGAGSDFLSPSLRTLYGHAPLLTAEFIPPIPKLIPLLFSLGGVLLSLLLHFSFFHLLVVATAAPLRPLFRFLTRRWHFDRFQNLFLTYPSLRFGYAVGFRLLDRGFLEQLGPMGLSRSFAFLSASYSRLHSGYLYHYLFTMVTALALLLALLTVPLPLGRSLLLLALLLPFASLSSDPKNQNP